MGHEIRSPRYTYMSRSGIVFLVLGPTSMQERTLHGNLRSVSDSDADAIRFVGALLALYSYSL